MAKVNIPALTRRYVRRLEGWGYDADRRIKPHALNYIHWFVKHHLPGTVLDLGSGLSTLVLASWNGGRVYTTDHDRQWLEFTRAHLQAEQLEVAGSALHGNFMLTRPRGWPRKYDLILVDQGPTMITRAKETGAVCELLEEGGTLLLDDWHGAYKKAVTERLQHAGFRPEQLPETLDDRGSTLAKATRWTPGPYSDT